MATYTCPQGHESNDSEWCDTCGARIGGSSAPDPQAPPSGPPATSSPPPGAVSEPDTPCPHCGALNVGGALFCEGCGYDFTTGQAPEAPPEPSPVSAGAQAPGAQAGAPPWVVVVEVDPQWYALKGSLADRPCPPANTYTVALSTHTALIGRSSSSRGVHPDIALDRDTGVSRRHAQLVSDGDQLTVVDLASTNGTYVLASPGGPDAEPDADLDPLAPDEVRQLADGDRIYLGAWTRLTVRRA